MIKEKDNTKSLYLYTALIFIAALVMIIISFFGQRNLEKINQATQDNKSISEKSAALSEENSRLVKENRDLQEIIAFKDNVIEENKALIETHNTLFAAHKYFVLGDFITAERLLSTVDTNMLDGDSQALYWKMFNDINEGKEE